MEDVILTLRECHDIPHLSVLAQQNGQLLYTPILLSVRHKRVASCESSKLMGLFIFHQNKLDIQENVDYSTSVSSFYLLVIRR